MARLLVVDDDYSSLQTLEMILQTAGHEVVLAWDGLEALEKVRSEPLDLVLTDLVMPRMDGAELLQALRQINERLVVIVITGYGTITNAVEAMRAGAYDYIEKPFDPDQLEIRVARGLEHAKLRADADLLHGQEQKGQRFGRLLGKSGAMQRLYDLIRRVAPSKTPVLLLGESGTGKELVAREIHDRSPRAKGPFVPVSCAAIPESLLESELFGHTKGAFTDAIADRRGLLEQAKGGTLFLDEITETPVVLQSKLLRVLEESEIRKLGHEHPVPIDVRIVAASNRDVHEAIRRKQFREDLYYRLSVVCLELPLLRERKEDIPILAEHFLRKYSLERQKPGRGISVPAMRRLLDHSWPGNVRELENAMERAVLLCTGDQITTEDLPLELSTEQVPVMLRAEHTTGLPTLAQLERQHIERVLRLANGDKRRASKMLGIGRTTLYRKLKENSSDERFGRLVGKTGAMHHLYESIRRVAPSMSPVLLLGESGTGKELVAREIHERSLRANGPFVPVSCAAIPEGLQESELFGHKKGAFTDAVADRRGFFQVAEGGTLFLDEITEATPEVQVKLLRVLEESKIHRLGDPHPVKVDVRILAATNLDVREAIRRGKLREDLYYRLNVVSLELPPLRERKADIPLLADHFLQKYNREYQKEVSSLSPRVTWVLSNNPWIGNVRELENVIERAVVLCARDQIDVEDLPPELVKDPLPSWLGSSPGDVVPTLAELGCQHIERVLRLSKGDKRRAAKMLGIGRNTLYRRLRKYGYHGSETKGEEPPC